MSEITASFTESVQNTYFSHSKKQGREPSSGASSSWAPDFSLSRVWKAFGEAHKSVYLGSGGRLGSSLAWIPMLLLSTRGRRTGLVRTMPLAFMQDPEDANAFVVVASNGGSEKPPAWWLNLTTNGVATVQVGRESFWVRAELAPPDRRPLLWKQLRNKIPPYRAYEKIDREIPIVRLIRIPAEVVPTSIDPPKPKRTPQKKRATNRSKP